MEQLREEIMIYNKLITNNIDCKSPIISDMLKEYTYAEIHKAVLDMSDKVMKMGANNAQRILIINGNTIDTIISIFTCIYLNICFIIVPKESSAEQIEYIVSDALPFMIIDSSKYKNTELKLTGMNNDIKLDNLIYIIYTSGSTGRPKGVMAPENQVLFCIEAINERLQNNFNDRILCCLPLSFDYGLYQLFFAFMYRSYLVLPYEPMIMQIPQLLKKERITAFPSMPVMLSSLIQTGLLQKISLPHLRYITSTGDNFPVALIQKIKKILPQTEVIPMYGQTECKRVSIMPFGCIEKTLAGSCGLPLKDVKVWIDEPDKEGIGELIISGPNVMKGYLNTDTISSEYFFNHPEYGKCLRTGDLFKMDSEGYLYFYARKRRIIKVRGYRIGNLELEEKIQEKLNIPYISVRIIGKSDMLTGEQIVLCISSDMEVNILTDRIKRIVADFPRYQQPTKIYITKKAFPLSANGKIDDYMLLKEVEANGANTV